VSTPNVVVLDYGFGNVRSAVRALERVGATVELTADAHAAEQSDGLVVPGVGAFAACMDGLHKVQGPQVIERRLADDRCVLGICVGMQVLFTRGDEHGVWTEGIGEWRGTVERLHAKLLPHMGWNTVTPPYGSAMLAGIENERFYFVHSYGVRSWDLPAGRKPAPLVSWTEYAADKFIAAVEDGPLWATQFHPEKSGDAGSTLLQNWVRQL
jgi:glutamine amidotransferase